jgi:bacterioferritin-associated ferredoxin
MLVCLCTGATSEIVACAVARGARTCKQVAAACGAGAACGRCRHNVRAIIAADCPSDDAASTIKPSRRFDSAAPGHTPQATRWPARL